MNYNFKQLFIYKKIVINDIKQKFKSVDVTRQNFKLEGKNIYMLKQVVTWRNLKIQVSPLVYIVIVILIKFVLTV